MTDAQATLATLENRLEQVHCLITTLIMAGEAENADMTPRLMSGALWSAQELVGQAQDAFREMDGPAKPDSPVMMDGEPIRNLEKELIGVLREVVEKIGLAESRGSYLLDHIDESRPKRDKAAVNGAPGGES